MTILICALTELHQNNRNKDADTGNMLLNCEVIILPQIYIGILKDSPGLINCIHCIGCGEATLPYLWRKETSTQIQSLQTLFQGQWPNIQVKMIKHCETNTRVRNDRNSIQSKTSIKASDIGLINKI